MRACVLHTAGVWRTQMEAVLHAHQQHTARPGSAEKLQPAAPNRKRAGDCTTLALGRNTRISLLQDDKRRRAARSAVCWEPDGRLLGSCQEAVGKLRRAPLLSPPKAVTQIRMTPTLPMDTCACACTSLRAGANSAAHAHGALPLLAACAPLRTAWRDAGVAGSKARGLLPPARGCAAAPPNRRLLQSADNGVGEGGGVAGAADVRGQQGLVAALVHVQHCCLEPGDCGRSGRRRDGGVWVWVRVGGWKWRWRVNGVFGPGEEAGAEELWRVAALAHVQHCRLTPGGREGAGR